MTHEAPTPEPTAAENCTICGYSFDGLHERSLCPECGHIERTARTELLVAGRRVHLGVKLVQGAILSALMVWLLISVFSFFVVWVFQNVSAHWHTALLAVTGPIAMAVPVLAIAGVWQLTTGPDSDASANAHTRLMARGVLACSILTLLIGTVIPNKLEPLWGIIAAGMAVAAGVGVILLERVRSKLGERLGVGGRVRLGFFGKALLVCAAVLIMSVPLRVVQHLVGGLSLSWDTFAGWTAWLLLFGLLYYANMFVRVLELAGIVKDPTAVPAAAGASSGTPSGAAPGC